MSVKTKGWYLMAKKSATKKSKAKKKTAKKKVAKKKVTKKKVTKKKVTKKAAAKKKTTKKAATKKTTTPKTASEELTHINLRLNFICNSLEKVLAAVNTLLGDPQAITQTQATGKTAEPEQMSLFDQQPANTENTFSKEDVSQALQEVMAVNGQDEVKGILKTLNASRVSEIKEADYGLAMELCTKASAGMTETQAEPQNDTTSIF